MYEVVSWATDEFGGRLEALPRHLLGIGDVDDLIRGVELGIDTFDCAMPTRLGRHGTALVPAPGDRWRVDLTKGRWRQSDEPLMEGCPCPACRAGLSRAYLSYLARAGELTGMRLLTTHNLTFLARLMSDLRSAVIEGDLARTAADLRAGAAPGERRAARRRLRLARRYCVLLLTSWSSALTSPCTLCSVTGLSLTVVWPPDWETITAITAMTITAIINAASTRPARLARGAAATGS